MSNEEAKAARKQYAKVIDYKRTFQSQSGRRVLQDLMDVHHMLRVSFDEENTHTTSFKEGERNVILRILQILKIDVEKLRDHIEEIEKNARGHESNTNYTIF